jgi:hypothetical protein
LFDLFEKSIDDIQAIDKQEFADVLANSLNEINERAGEVLDDLKEAFNLKKSNTHFFKNLFSGKFKEAWNDAKKNTYKGIISTTSAFTKDNIVGE